ncbi:membrane protein of ER body-like protein isoform X2 [Phalaenopsis equestris]|uniref:membrane protein of ER body-like protein isoform X2 n=1 Tax=Phalaenopsis equestris TaxID=78828 RepID=UPI0009E1A341|nr:membrane protein of ER body-like protein isoform X2 [Phalaenopsis equestris]
MATETTPATLMETVQKKQWTDDEEEEKDVAGEVDGDCGLDTKRRRRPTSGNHTPATFVDDAADEDASSGKDSQSVPLEEDQGTEFFSPDGTTLKSTETEFSVADKKLENGNSAFADILDDLQNVLEVEDGDEKQDCNHVNIENGLNLQIDSVKKVEDEIVPTTDPETQTHRHNEVVETLKLDVSELDLEKVLEEQETHDLFCPNCHSCITKRVILRKRKRRVQDFRYEERPEKLHVRPNIVSTSTEVVETIRDDEPDVFRCLSCFSFFIPRENGFDIFPFFRKREESVKVQIPNIQSSGQTSTRDGSWLSLFFKPESSRNKGKDSVPIPAAVLPAQSPMTPNIGYSEQNNQKSPVLTASETPNNAEITKSKFAGAVPIPAAVLPGQSSTTPHVGYSEQNNQKSPVLTASETPNNADITKPIYAGAAQFQPQLEVSFGGDHNLEIEESYASDGKLHSAAQFPVVIEVSAGGGRSGNENENSVALPVSETASTGENYSTTLKIKSDDDEILPVVINKPARPGGFHQNDNDAVETIPPVFLSHDDDMIKPIVVVESPPQRTSQQDLSISISSGLSTVLLPLGGDVQINVSNPMLVRETRGNEWEVLKSIVYGGLLESITSLGVISSAAGAKTSTLNIVALGLANLTGGFFVLLHDLSDLKSSPPTPQNDERSGRYWKLLGKKSNFGLHATVAIISYIFFGLLPPIIYGFSFRERDLKEEKLIVVGLSSLLCIALLSIGKAHVSEPKAYIKTFIYYLGLGFSASGLSFVAGVLIHRFMVKLGLFEHDAPPPLPPPSINLFGAISGLSSLAAR